MIASARKTIRNSRARGETRQGWRCRQEVRRGRVEINPEEDYSLIGVYSFGKGRFRRDPQLGIDVGAHKVSEMRPGNFVMSNVQAREGTIGYAT